MNMQELIAAHKGGRTYAELEQASGYTQPEPGSGVGRSRWMMLATRDLPSRPPEATLDAIARGLGIDRAEVDEAVKMLPIPID